MNKKVKVLLIGGNFSPEPTGIGKYNGEMIDWLSKNGYTCTVITTYPYYPDWKVYQDYKKRSSWYSREKAGSAENPITILRCPHYIPKKPSGSRRVLSDVTFFVTAFFRLLPLLFKSRHQFVITVAPPFQIGMLGYMYKLLKRSKLVYHIQDLQIDAAKELNMIRSKALLRPMFGMERFILKRADVVSSISEGMIRKIRSKYQGKDILMFPNWADTKKFFPVTDAADFKASYGYSKDDIVVLYSGAIGEKQGLEIILQAAGMINDPKYKFIICGTGPYREKLEAQAQELKLANLRFLPLQPMETFNQFLNMADIHLVIQKEHAEDLVMPSKLTTILAVGGLAIVTSSSASNLYQLATKYRMTLIIDPGQPAQLAQTILGVNKEYLQEIRNNARKYAEEFLSKDIVINRFMKEADQLANKN